MRRTFAAYLANSTKLSSMLHTVVPVPDFNNESFYKPISLQQDSSFHFSPFSIVSSTPRTEMIYSQHFSKLEKSRESMIYKDFAFPP
eukprot:2406774-Ditylum_brightwellii.AAC.1